MPYFSGTDAGETLTGGDDAAQIFGQGGDDSLVGGAGNDQLTGGPGVDTLLGGEGDDRLRDDDSSGQMLGGPGFDIITSVQLSTTGGSLFIDGGDGIDVVSISRRSGSGMATILGGTGSDELRRYGDLGGLIDAGAGADVVVIGDSYASRLRQAVTITLGEGADRFRYDLPVGHPAITITDFTPGDAGDRLLIDLSIWLSGWDGQTNPFAAGFFQLLQSGADTILRLDYDGPARASGAFTDIIRLQNVEAGTLTAFNLFDWASSGAVPPPAAGNTPTEGTDELRGSNGPDSIGGLGGYDLITGGAGADTLDGGAGNDDVQGEEGSDNILGGAGDDYLYGDTPYATIGGHDTLFGGDGRDSLDGGVGDDQLFGGAGDDKIVGAAGSNYLRGDDGNDTIAGGSDFDDINGKAGVDKVTDFSAGEGDRVQLDPGTAYTLVQDGADLVIELGGGNRMTLVGVQLSSLPDGWIYYGG